MSSVVTRACVSYVRRSILPTLALAPHQVRRYVSGYIEYTVVGVALQAFTAAAFWLLGRTGGFFTKCFVGGAHRAIEKRKSYQKIAKELGESLCRSRTLMLCERLN